MSPDLDLDRLVRDTLDDLAADARPAPLLAEAIRRAGQIRRRRIAATAAAAAVLVVLGVVALPFGADREDRPEPLRSVPSAPLSPSPTASPFAVGHAPPSLLPPELPGQFTLTALPFHDDQTWVFDRSTGRYLTVPFAEVQPAPKGNLALSATGDGRLLLLDLAEGVAVSLPSGPVGGDIEPWSPDGRMLLRAQQPTGLVRVEEVVGGTVLSRGVPYDAAALGCERTGCRVTWARSPTELAVSVIDPATGTQRALQLISVADGRPTRRLPVTGQVSGACSWSTDERYVLNERLTPTGSAGWVITDTTSGATVGTMTAETLPNPSSVCWASPTELLVGAIGEVLVVKPDGTVRQRIDTFTGAGNGPYWVRIGHR
ncbi:hypothetical protein GCM10010399_58060 [Dactylosporangium fulvum]|uniref:Lipoprotein LpqB beta-propeller domain-containing protein n=1 Tax=Dactylosporangium fulvum TaxID=53359 RepID=A0ABY5W0W5_9ACTN|nr:hypothetical protein [Dactylosporangium fulvum]UWP83628.1 hypothetical protein Dfulv_04980 [Dactylosporangium fulvum]